MNPSQSGPDIRPNAQVEEEEEERRGGRVLTDAHLEKTKIQADGGRRNRRVLRMSSIASNATIAGSVWDFPMDFMKDSETNTGDRKV